jgi:hypothetical protein
MGNLKEVYSQVLGIVSTILNLFVGTVEFYDIGK